MSHELLDAIVVMTLLSVPSRLRNDSFFWGMDQDYQMKHGFAKLLKFCELQDEYPRRKL